MKKINGVIITCSFIKKSQIFLLAIIGFAIIRPGTVLGQAPHVVYPNHDDFANVLPGLPIAITPVNSGGAVPALIYGTVSTFAGSGVTGGTNGTGTAASFNDPFGIASDKLGNIYVADYTGNLIRKITHTGVVTILAGSGITGSADGTGAAASFSNPAGIAADSIGNLYVADFNNNTIRKITPAGVVTTFAGSGTDGSANGTGTAASFHNPSGVALDAAGNIFVTDGGNNLIRKIDTAGVVTTFAGSGAVGVDNGTGTAASFNSPHGLTIDGFGNMYVADGGSRIRKITPAGEVSVFAGSGSTGTKDGYGISDDFHFPYAVVANKEGYVFVADEGNDRIRMISPDRWVTTIAGSTGGILNAVGTAAKFRSPHGLALDTAGNLYVADFGNNRIRKVLITGYDCANFNIATWLSFNLTNGVIAGKPPVVNSNGSEYNFLTVGAYNKYGHSFSYVYIDIAKKVKVPNISYTNSAAFLTGTSVSLIPANTGGGIQPSTYGNVTAAAGSATAGSGNGTGTAAGFNNPAGIITDLYGDVFVADHTNNTIRKMDLSGVVTTLAGSGTAGSTDARGTAASFNMPSGIAVDYFGNLYIADAGNNLVRKLTYDGYVTTVAGSGTAGSVNGTGISASFNDPRGITVDGIGDVFVAEYGGNAIRKIAPGGITTTLAGGGTAGNANGTGTAASFSNPAGLAIDTAGNIYVADAGNNLIRMVSPAGVVSTYAGSGTAGFADGSRFSATFNAPYSINFDQGGNMYVADEGNNAIRKITPAGIVTTLAGNGASGNVNAVGTAATFNAPHGLAVDLLGNVFVADYNNNTIRKVATGGYTISSPLSPGLIFDHASGTITGTPTAPARNTNYVVTAHNASGASSVTLNITVNLPVPVIAYSDSIYFTKGKNALLLPKNSGGPVPDNLYGQAGTLAGSGTAGSNNGTGTAASFNSPFGMATDTAGNIYEADYSGNQVRKTTPAGVVTTLAGSGSAGNTNGTGLAASFHNPAGLAVDASGNVYVADLGNSQIRKISPAGVVTTLAGSGTAAFANGTGAAASFNNPTGVALDAAGNVLVTDAGNNRVRKVSPLGVVTTLAGNGTAGSLDGADTVATFNNPQGLAINSTGNIFVADGGNLIRKIAANGAVTTFAGSGTAGATDSTGTAASFNFPYALAIDQAGDLFVADGGNNSIRKITPAALVTTLAGNGTAGLADSIGRAAKFNDPHGITIDLAGNLYVADYANNLVRKVTPTGYAITPALPSALTLHNNGVINGIPQVTSTHINYTITAYNSSGSDSSVVNITVLPPLPKPIISYTSPQVYTENSTIPTLSPVNTGGAVPAAVYSKMSYFAGSTYSYHGYPVEHGPNGAANFGAIYGDATDNAGNVYVTDVYTSSTIVSKITPNSVVTSLAGSTAGYVNATGSSAKFNYPTAVATDGAGNVYVADLLNHVIRKISPAGAVSTFAGSGTAGFVNGVGTAASFHSPDGIVVARSGNVFVSDEGNHVIRKITPDGTVTTFAGSGAIGSANGTRSGASFDSPHGLAIDTAGNIYVADGNNRIRKMTGTGIVTTLAGSGLYRYANGTGLAASFKNPIGVCVDAEGNVYVADKDASRIRKITPAGVVTTFAGYGKAHLIYSTGTSAGIPVPTAISIDESGNIFVPTQNTVVKFKTTGYTISPALPAGLNFDGTTGVISGSAFVTRGATDYAVIARNASGSDTAVVNITVNAPPGMAIAQIDILADSTIGQPRVNPAISPNGDSKNDVLTIANIEKYPDNKFTIMSTAGSKIFQTTGYDNATNIFDGHVGKTKALQKPGTYFYKLQYKDNNILKYKTGYILIKY